MHRHGFDQELGTDTRTSTVGDAAIPSRPRVLGLSILCHPDARRVGETAALPELASGRAARLSRRTPTFAQPGEQGEFRPLALAHLSRRPLELAPGPEPGGITLRCAGSRTRVSVGGEAVEKSRSFSASEVERGVVVVLSRRVALLLHLVDPIPDSAPRFGLVGESDAILRLRREIETAAGVDVAVLLRGETGTGKELVARALHEAGVRRGRPFVTVNMAALPPPLAASELFGAVRGAYTGADRGKKGFFQSAEGGTLFLDEIGEVAPEVQALLLRALENREVQPVGSVETRRVDVRVIAATDSDLESAIASGRFRAPLLHRLAGYEIRVPALRERRDDVARLLYHFLGEGRGGEARRTAAGERPWPPAEVVARLACYDWPGNVRQLGNVARRLALAASAGRDHDLGRLVDELLRDSWLPGAADSTSEVTDRASRGFRKLAEVGQDELAEALESHGWHLKPAARALGVSRATLYRLIESSPRIRKASELEAREIEAALERHGGDSEACARELRVSPQGLKRRITALGLR